MIPPVVAIVGKSRVGKTTLIEKLIAELTSRGYRIATIKSTVHNIPFDVPGKDTWRHLNAGSLATVLSSANGILAIKITRNKSDLNEALKFLRADDGYDLIIVEGYKGSEVPKIEVHRKEKGQPVINLKNLIAIATDEVLDTNIKQLALDDVRAISDFIERKIIKDTQ